MPVKTRRGAVMLEYVLIGLVAIAIFAVVGGLLAGEDGFFADLIGRFTGLIDGTGLGG